MFSQFDIATAAFHHTVHKLCLAYKVKINNENPYSLDFLFGQQLIFVMQEVIKTPAELNATGGFC